MVARRAHNPKVVGSNPAPATKFKKARLTSLAFLVLKWARRGRTLLLPWALKTGEGRRFKSGPRYQI